MDPQEQDLQNKLNNQYEWLVKKSGISNNPYLNQLSGLSGGTPSLHNGTWKWKHIPRPCNVCGKDLDNLAAIAGGIQICGECNRKMIEIQAKSLVPEEVRCNECGWHIKSCECEKTQKLKGMGE